MALIKDYSTPFGVTANYHKINKIEIVPSRSAISILVAVYITEAARNAGNEPIWNDYIEIPFAAFKSDPRQAFYPLLETYINSYLLSAQPSFTGDLDIANALVLKPHEPISLPAEPAPTPPAPIPPLP
jgi:hypothetical protein